MTKNEFLDRMADIDERYQESKRKLRMEYLDSKRKLTVECGDVAGLVECGDIVGLVECGDIVEGWQGKVRVEAYEFYNTSKNDEGVPGIKYYGTRLKANNEPREPIEKVWVYKRD